MIFFTISIGAPCRQRSCLGNPSPERKELDKYTGRCSNPLRREYVGTMSTGYLYPEINLQSRNKETKTLYITTCRLKGNYPLPPKEWLQLVLKGME